MSRDLSAAIGAGSSLPIVRSDGVELDCRPLSRRATRLVRRASGVVAALRAAGVRGTASVAAGGESVLGLQTIQVKVWTGDHSYFVVVADVNRRGRVHGILGQSVRIAVGEHSSRSRGRDMRTGATWVDIDRGPDATRTDLLLALMSALAPQVWDEVTRELGKARNVNLHRAESSGGSRLVVDTTGPAGHVVAHIEESGHMHGLMQLTGSSWTRGEGAFGRFLAAEFRASLDVEHEAEVFGPFMHRLAATSRAFSGLPATVLAGMED